MVGTRARKRGKNHETVAVSEDVVSVVSERATSPSPSKSRRRSSRRRKSPLEAAGVNLEKELETPKKANVRVGSENVVNHSQVETGAPIARKRRVSTMDKLLVSSSKRSSKNHAATLKSNLSSNAISLFCMFSLKNQGKKKNDYPKREEKYRFVLEMEC